jgi:voltage-gated potassium channel
VNRRGLDVAVITAALLVIPSVYLETEAHGGWQRVGGVLDWIIWIVFALEFIVLISAAPNRWRWLREHPLEVVIVFLTPPFAPASVQSLRVFRLLRVTRLIRLAPVMRRTFSLEGVKYLGVLTALAVVGGAEAYSGAENVSAWNGLWWAFTTTTTVGYGDIYPHTVLGRLIAMGLMLLGIGFVAVVTGAIAQRFLAQETARVVREAEQLEEAEFDVLVELREVVARIERIEQALSRTAHGPK